MKCCTTKSAHPAFVKIDFEGNVVLSTGEYGVNKAGFVIQAAVYAARHDAFCVARTHTAAGMEISALECGLLPISQTSMRFYQIAYHDFDGMAEDHAIGQKIAADAQLHDSTQTRSARLRPHSG
jgi:ribulose-5-phosphate 4-epimerase/fuculose-1-phosphate aldolase